MNNFRKDKFLREKWIFLISFDFGCKVLSHLARNLCPGSPFCFLSIKSNVLKKNSWSKYFSVWFISDFGRKIVFEGSSKLHFMCPEEEFEEKIHLRTICFNFWSSHVELENFGLFGGKTWAGLWKLYPICLEGKMSKKLSLGNIWYSLSHWCFEHKLLWLFAAKSTSARLSEIQSLCPEYHLD